MKMRRLGAFLTMCVLMTACGTDEEGVAEPASPVAAESTSSSTSAPEESTEVESAAVTAEAESDSSVLASNTVPVLAQDLAWERCLNRFECTTVVVPLDYDDPDGDTADLAVMRSLAVDQDARIGSVFVNPGGPGFGAEFMVQGLFDFAPFSLAEKFDIVGIDPRGTGRSNAIDCNSDWEEDIDVPISEDDGLADDVETYLDGFRSMATECTEEHDLDYLASIGTENAARDLEAVRILLGDEPLNYIGASYGTALGAVYATMFPDNIRTLVLDGAVVPDDGAIGREHLDDIDLQIQRLDAACDLWEDCPVAAEGWIESIEILDAQLADGPIGPLGLGEFWNVVGLTVPAPTFMPDVAAGLAAALDGDGAFLTGMSNDFLTPLPDSGNPAEYAGGFAAIECADGVDWDHVATDELLAVAESTARAHPDVGPLFGLPCDEWPVRGDGLPAIDYTGSAPVLVVGNSGDAITPLRFAEDMAAAFGEQGHLLTWDATGHVAFSFGSSCIDDHVMTYLIELTTPAEGTSCGVEGLIGVQLSPAMTVQDLLPGGSAEQAGVLRGDRIVAVDGAQASSPEDLPAGAAGSITTLTIDRDGTSLDLDVERQYPVWELWRLEE